MTGNKFDSNCDSVEFVVVLSIAVVELVPVAVVLQVMLAEQVQLVPDSIRFVLKVYSLQNLDLMN